MNFFRETNYKLDIPVPPPHEGLKKKYADAIEWKNSIDYDFRNGYTPKYVGLEYSLLECGCPGENTGNDTPNLIPSTEEPIAPIFVDGPLNDGNVGGETNDVVDNNQGNVDTNGVSDVVLAEPIYILDQETGKITGYYYPHDPNTIYPYGEENTGVPLEIDNSNDVAVNIIPPRPYIPEGLPE